jgi:hypothetical protein
MKTEVAWSVVCSVVVDAGGEEMKRLCRHVAKGMMCFTVHTYSFDASPIAAWHDGEVPVFV